MSKIYKAGMWYFFGTMFTVQMMGVEMWSGMWFFWFAAWAVTGVNLLRLVDDD